MRFLRRSLTGVFLLAATLALLAVAIGTVRGAVVAKMNEEPRSFPSRERVFAVNVTEVVPSTLSPQLRTFGEILSRRTLDLRAGASGTVLEVSDALVDGGAVEAGEVLLRIDPATAQAARDRTAADQRDAQAEVRDADRGLELARDELAAAEAQVSLRQTSLDRARDLADRGVGTQSSVEEAELALSSAQGSVLTRRQALASAEARIDAAATALDRARIDLTEADRTLQDTTVEAPFAGILSEVAIAEGTRVTANEQLAVLLDPDLLDVSFRVSTAQFARLVAGAGGIEGLPVRVSLGGGDEVTAEGRIDRVGGAVGEGQTGRLLFATLDGAAALRPGDFVTVVVEEPSLDDVARVPATAVAADETVLVVGEGDRLESRQTRILRRQGDDVLIAAEDLAGARIVSERSPLLGAGIGVRPLSEDGTPAEPDPPVALDDERRAALKSLVEGSEMPEAVKTRLLAQLDAPEVPAETIARIEGTAGG
ncbi:HlyD family efflux transporter periplasmic adaptor subunit [Salipiger sp. IMCC34102]|uniref:efflux RND transporter periplasmic adaptor subunit n=1 Tax=Salipiger sp. IMCC34102 TaxID=2510647 RepID=UPI00101DE902|nr:HlyD family efflux transporter periplasmic adaptor subunit [Salipiger sp. IMCC34102]RYH01395.1 HlyD family efflux transporter periplasmic adaptor subunit [Salipiger sp. IMCC34102]